MGQEKSLSRPDYYIRVGITYQDLNVILQVPSSTFNGFQYAAGNVFLTWVYQLQMYKMYLV